MATDAQIAANRLNSQKSTGPLSPEGKATSAQNRLSHGLTYTGGKFNVLPCEDQSDFDRLLDNLTGEFSPTIPSEMLLVQRMAQSQWLRDRAIRLQETCFDPASGQIADEKKFSLYQRYATAHDRAFHIARKAYLSFRKLDQSIQIGFEREMRAQALHPMRSLLQQGENEYREMRNWELKSQAARSERLSELQGEPKADLQATRQAA
jgi:hypothetical protein